MIHLLIYVAATCVGLYVVVYHFRRSKSISAQTQELGFLPPPTFPSRLPAAIDLVIEEIWAVRKDRWLELVSERFQAIGCALTYVTGMPGGEFWTADEKNIQAILATNSDDWGVAGLRRDAMYPFLGDGIFTTDGEIWHQSRAMLKPIFARSLISDLKREEQHFQNLLIRMSLSPAVDGWTGEIELLPMFFCYSLDSSLELLLGAPGTSQTMETDRLAGERFEKGAKMDFESAYDIAMEAMTLRLFLPGLAWLLWSPKYTPASQTCFSVIEDVIQRRSQQNQNGAKHAFVDDLVGETEDPVRIRSELIQLMFAGRDTTASLLGWIFVCLGRDLKIFKKLREIVVDDFGTYDNSQDISFERLKACKYLQWVLNETLRLYPLVPSNFRIATKDTVLPRGGGPDGQGKVFIPAGNSVELSLHILHRRKDIWGLDADEFRPERWECRKKGWDYIPVCISKWLYSLVDTNSLLV